MTQFLFFDGNINKENTLELASQLNQLISFSLENPNTELRASLYYSSVGGFCYWAEYQVDMLNKCLEFFNIEIITGSDIMSSAVDVLLHFKGNVTVSPITKAMVHQVSTELLTKDLKNTDSLEYFVLKQNSQLNASALNKVKSILTEGEIARFKKGDEIYFDYKKLKKLINGEWASITKTKAKKSKKSDQIQTPVNGGTEISKS